MFDDILGAPVVRNKIDVEIPLTKAPLIVEEEEEDKEEEEEEEKREKEKEKKEEKETETLSIQVEDRVDDPNTTMTIYQSAGSAPTDTGDPNDDTPVTRREFRQMWTALQSKLDQMLAPLMKKD